MAFPLIEIGKAIDLPFIDAGKSIWDGFYHHGAFAWAPLFFSVHRASPER